MYRPFLGMFNAAYSQVNILSNNFLASFVFILLGPEKYIFSKFTELINAELHG